MSKAFTKDDAAPEAPVVAPRAHLPDGVQNYVTPRGLSLLRDELAALKAERAHLGAEGANDASERATVLSARLAELEHRIAVATLVEAPSQRLDTVRFGATVTVRDGTGADRKFQIVGVDEANADAGLVAFVAPLARAVLGLREGDMANVKTPRGAEELEIVAIA